MSELLIYRQEGKAFDLVGAIVGRDPAKLCGRFIELHEIGSITDECVFEDEGAISSYSPAMVVHRIELRTRQRMVNQTELAHTRLPERDLLDALQIPPYAERSIEPSAMRVRFFWRVGVVDPLMHERIFDLDVFEPAGDNTHGVGLEDDFWRRYEAGEFRAKPEPLTGSLTEDRRIAREAWEGHKTRSKSRVVVGPKEEPGRKVLSKGHREELEKHLLDAEEKHMAEIMARPGKTLEDLERQLRAPAEVFDLETFLQLA